MSQRTDDGLGWLHATVRVLSALDVTCTEFVQNTEFMHEFPPRPERRLHGGLPDQAGNSVGHNGAQLIQTIGWREVEELHAVLAQNSSRIQALRVGACSSAVPLGSTDLGVEHMYMRLHTLRAQIGAAIAARPVVLMSLNAEMEREMYAFQRSRDMLEHHVHAQSGVDSFETTSGHAVEPGE